MDEDGVLLVILSEQGCSVIIAENRYGTVTANKTTAAEGKTVILTVTPDTGYELERLSVTGPNGEIAVTNNQFTMPAGNVNVTAAFRRAIMELTVSADYKDDVAYDGEAHGLSDFYENVTISGVLAGDDVTITSADSVTGAGAHTFHLTLTGDDAAYCVLAEGGETLDAAIAKAEAKIDVSGVETEYTYTGEEQVVSGGATLNHSECNTFTTLYTMMYQDPEAEEAMLLPSTLLLMPDELPEHQDDVAHHFIVTIPEEADEQHIITYNPKARLIPYRHYALAADYAGEGIYSVCEVK